MFFSKLWQSINNSHYHLAVVRTTLIQLMMLGATAVVSIFVSRALGPEGRGLSSWMIAFASCGSICTVVGMAQTSKKFISRAPLKLPVCAVINILMLSVSQLILLPLFLRYGSAAPIPQHAPDAFSAALVLIPGLAISLVCNDMLLGLSRSLHSNILLVIEKTINLTLNIGLLFFSQITPVAIVTTYAIAIACRIAVSFYYLRPHFRHLPSLADVKEGFREIRHTIVSAYISSMAAYFAGMCLTFSLGLFSSAKELGYFAVSKLIVDNILVIPLTMASLTLPHLTNQKSEELYQKTKHNIIIMVVVVMLSTTTPLYFFSEAVIRFLFGASFLPASDCLHIIVLGMLANGIVMVFNQIIATQPKEYLYMLSPLAIATCMGLLVYCFHSNLSALTGAYIYCISYWMGVLVCITPVTMARLTHSKL